MATEIPGAGGPSEIGNNVTPPQGPEGPKGGSLVDKQPGGIPMLDQNRPDIRRPSQPRLGTTPGAYPYETGPMFDAGRPDAEGAETALPILSTTGPDGEEVRPAQPAQPGLPAAGGASGEPTGGPVRREPGAVGRPGDPSGEVEIPDVMTDERKDQLQDADIPDDLAHFINRRGFAGDYINFFTGVRNAIEVGHDEALPEALGTFPTYEKYWTDKIDSHYAPRPGEPALTPEQQDELDRRKTNLVDVIVHKQPGVDQLNDVVTQVKELHREDVTGAEIREDFAQLFEAADTIIYPQEPEELPAEVTPEAAELPPVSVDEIRDLIDQIGLTDENVRVGDNGLVGSYHEALALRWHAVQTGPETGRIGEEETKLLLHQLPDYGEFVANHIELPRDIDELDKDDLMYALNNTEAARVMAESGRVFKEAADAEALSDPAVRERLEAAYRSAVEASYPPQTNGPENPPTPTAGNGGGEHTNEGKEGEPAADRPLDQRVVNGLLRPKGLEGDMPITPTMLEIWNTLPEDARRLLERRFIDGVKLEDLGVEFGGDRPVSKEAIRLRLKGYEEKMSGVASPYGTRGLSDEAAEELHARAFDMLDEPGQNLTTVGKALGVSALTVRRWVDIEGEKRKKEPQVKSVAKPVELTPEQREDIYVRAREGESYAKLGREVGLTRSAVTEWVKVEAARRGDPPPAPRRRGSQPRRDKE